MIIEKFKRSMEGFIGQVIEIVFYDGSVEKGVLLGIHGDYLAVQLNDSVVYVVIDKMQACVKNTKDYNKPKITMAYYNRTQFTDVLDACKNQWVTVNCFHKSPFTGVLSKIEEEYIVLIEHGRIIYTKRAAISSFCDGIYKANETVTDNSQQLDDDQKPAEVLEESVEEDQVTLQSETDSEDSAERQTESVEELITQQFVEQDIEPKKEPEAQQSIELAEEQEVQPLAEFSKEHEIRQLTVLLNRQVIKRQAELTIEQDIPLTEELLPVTESLSKDEAEYQEQGEVLASTNSEPSIGISIQQLISGQQEINQLHSKNSSKKRVNQSHSPYHQTMHGHLMKHLENKKSVQQQNESNILLEKNILDDHMLQPTPIQQEQRIIRTVRPLPSLKEWLQNNAANSSSTTKSQQLNIPSIQDNLPEVPLNSRIKKRNKKRFLRKKNPAKFIKYNQQQQFLTGHVSQRQNQTRLVEDHVYPEISNIIPVQQQQSLAIQYYALMQHAKKMSNEKAGFRTTTTRQYAALMQHAEKMYVQHNNRTLNNY